MRGGGAGSRGKKGKARKKGTRALNGKGVRGEEEIFLKGLRKCRKKP